MPSSRHRLLDAAREVILAVGWRRATLTDVARRAGVSRMTVYRAFPDMQSLLAELMTRELVDQFGAVVGGADPSGADQAADVLAREFTAAVGALRRNELFRRIMDVDPEQLLPYLLHRRGRSQDAVIGILGARIAQAQSTGGVRDGDPVLMARSLVLAAHGFALSVTTMTDDVLAPADFDSQLADLARRYLAP